MNVPNMGIINDTLCLSRDIQRDSDLVGRVRPYGWKRGQGRLQTPFLRVSFCCMDKERVIEAKIITDLLTLLNGTGRFKKVLKGEVIKRKTIGEMLSWNGAGLPWALTVPDLILAGDDFSKRPDDAFLLAVETKYFPDAASDKKRWRHNFREIGQPLRDLLYGFNAAVLWHLFSDTIADDEIGKYSAMCGEVIEKLKLPVVYFATKLTSQKRFAFFYPWRLENSSPLPDAVYVADCLQQINNERDGSYRAKMNPLLMDEKTLGMRKAVKSALRIP